MSIEYDVLSATQRPADPALVVTQVLDAHSLRGNPGRFRLERSGQILHVIPTAIKNSAGQLTPQTSILDAVITLPSEERTGMQALEAICAAISQATQTQVVIGAIPLNLFFQHRDRQGGATEKARDILVNLLENTKGGSLSWQLLYDPGLKMYALNIQHVPLPKG